MQHASLHRGAKVVAFHRSAGDCGADFPMNSREGATAILDRVAELVDEAAFPGA